MSFSLKKSPKWIPSKDCAVFVFPIKHCPAFILFQEKDILKCDLPFIVFLQSSQTFPEEFRISGWREKEE